MSLPNTPYLIVLSGPTAVGKTKLSMSLAQHYDIPILSADSRQIYREMTIGTAQPSKEQLKEVHHYFINSHSIHQPYTAGDYEKEAMAVLRKQYQSRNIALLVGGSQFYIQALLKGLDSFPTISSKTKEQVLFDLDQKGGANLQEELKEKDPQSYRSIDIQNPRRLARAIMVIRQSGKTFSSFKSRAPASRPFIPIYIQLVRPRVELYDRINQRVDLMVDAGLEEEARKLYPFRHLKACDTVGYREWFQYFDGTWDREKCIEKIKQHTRNYAKRQLTWFRKEADRWNQFAPDQEKEIRGFLQVEVESPK